MNVYVAAFTNEAVGRARSPITIAAHKKQCVEIAVPSQGLLERVTVYQIPEADGGGVPVAFAVELFNSKRPFAAGEHAFDDPFGVAKLEPFRVHTPVGSSLAALAGGVVAFTKDGYGAGYRNLDGTPSDEKGVLYMLINPADRADVTKWCAYIMVMEDGRV